MVQKIEKSKLQKAQAIIDTESERIRKTYLKIAMETVKMARKWRSDRRLGRMYVVTADWARYYIWDPNVVLKNGPDTEGN